VVNSLQVFSDWAWARHANVLSWYIRPLFLLPFVLFAYRRSWPGLAATLLALASSMFWFPAPTAPDPRVLRFLAAERGYLIAGWTAGKVALSALVPLTMTALAVAFWRRSFGWGLAVMTFIAVAKIVWSVAYDRGGVAVVAPAVVGLAITNGAVLLAARWTRRRERARAPSVVG
jgi:hypothetical protein